MNRRGGKSSNRKRSSEKEDDSLEPPPKIIRKSPGTNDIQAALNENGSVTLNRVASPMSTPYSNTRAGKAEKTTKKKTVVVTPPKSPPRGGGTSVVASGEVVEERMELSAVHAERLKGKEDDLTAQLGCDIHVNAGSSSAVVTFRGTRETVDAAKTMVSVICSQESLSAEGDNVTSTCGSLLRAGITTALNSVNDFFHARAGPGACLLGGWMRIGYAFLFIMDRLLWSLDLDYFFYQSGVLPTHMTRSYSYVEPDTMLTIFQLAPESDWLVWVVNYLCLLQGILLLLGVAPSFQSACLVLYLASFEHQNDHAWDSQDTMLRFFAFLLCFLPLHRLTIYEWWQTRGMSKQQKAALYVNDSWPMWPFRLWQLEICFIYAGAGLSKLANRRWRNGLAVYYATFTNHFGGIFVPEFLYNRIGPLKLMCYGSLFVECGSWILVWPLATRIPSLISIVLLHVGIDLSMNMNIFEWLSILGWMSFLAHPSERASGAMPVEVSSDDAESKVNGKTSHHCQSSRNGKHLRMISNVFIAAFLVVYGSETIPIHYVKRMAPSALKPALTSLGNTMEEVLELSEPWLYRVGIHQATWAMFSNPVGKSERYEAIVTFKDETKARWWSPDWNGMSWLEKKRNRRRQLYFNNLMEFKDEETVGQKRLCEWIAEQYEKDVVRIKLVYHRSDALEPSKDLGWFAKVPRDNVETWKETHYIHYTPQACNEWAMEGNCYTDPEFMLKRCAESCKDKYGDANDVEVGSRVIVYIKKESAFYTASVLKARDKKPNRFFLKWDYAEFGKEWFDLDTNVFSFVGKQKDASSHKSKQADRNRSEQKHDGEEL